MRSLVFQVFHTRHLKHALVGRRAVEQGKTQGIRGFFQRSRLVVAHRHQLQLVDLRDGVEVVAADTSKAPESIKVIAEEPKPVTEELKTAVEEIKPPTEETKTVTDEVKVPEEVKVVADSTAAPGVEEAKVPPGDAQPAPVETNPPAETKPLSEEPKTTTEEIKSPPEEVKLTPP